MKDDASSLLDSGDVFRDRHVGPRQEDISAMLKKIGLDSLESLIDQAVPSTIRFRESLSLSSAATEAEVLQELQDLAGRNEQHRSHIGTGYHDCITPPAIQRGILESPGWYTAYTPYQPEIAQGRLESLLNYQQMCIDLTGLELASASLLDEGTAAAEAMALEVKKITGLTRDSQDMSSQLSQAVFKAAKPIAGQPTVIVVATPEGAQTVINLLAVNDGTETAEDAEKAKLATANIARALGQSDYAAVVDGMRQSTRVSIRE